MRCVLANRGPLPFHGKGPHLFLRAGLRTARGKITTGVPKSLDWRLIFIVCNVKVVSIHAWTSPDGSRTLKLPEFLDNRIFFYSISATSFANLAAGPLIQTGGQRVGDPWPNRLLYCIWHRRTTKRERDNEEGKCKTKRRKVDSVARNEDSKKVKC